MKRSGSEENLALTSWLGGKSVVEGNVVTQLSLYFLL
jgi:hypothetical protein